MSNETFGEIDGVSPEVQEGFERALDKQIEVYEDQGVMPQFSHRHDESFDNRTMAKIMALSTVKQMIEEANVADVTQAFGGFLEQYRLFRLKHKLNKEVTNIHEILVGAFDKLGRMSRQIKHFEREDPKDDWPEVLGEDAVGALIYILIALEHYDIDVVKGMENELKKAAEQHGGNQESEEEAPLSDYEEAPLSDHEEPF